MALKKEEDLTWGRRAALRFAKSPEEIRSEILKSLQGKLSVEFQSYAQWERIKSKDDETSHVSTKTSPATTTKEKFRKKKVKTTTDIQDVKPQYKSSSSLYLHPKVKDEEKDTPMIKVLRTRISAKKASVEAFQRLVDNMRENGRNLKGGIVKAEKKIYKNVSHDLERGMSYVIGSQMRKNQHKLRIDAAKKEMESLQCDIDAQLQVLEEAIEVADKKFMEQDADLQELHTYKDKLYPTQLLQINKLTNELKNIDDLHKVDDMKLKRIINEEMSSLKHKQHVSTSHNLDHIAHQTFINSRPNIIISLNKNNQILIKEINQQKQDIGELKKEIERLENENNEIKRSKTNDVRSVAFKHVFLQPDQKFGPDDDVIIDIPLPVVLPI